MDWLSSGFIFYFFFICVFFFFLTVFVNLSFAGFPSCRFMLTQVVQWIRWIFPREKQSQGATEVKHQKATNEKMKMFAAH